MERLFYIGCAITQGSSYISATAYGKMHRLHHTHTDTEEDPHSPDNTPNLFTMMWLTRNNYFDIYKSVTPVEEKYAKDLPRWDAFDSIFHNMFTRMIWITAYTTFYIIFATHWWMFLFLPFTIAMGSFQGAAVNWWAHRFGYVNYPMDNTSKNILPLDFIFWGEAFHNNHHQFPGRPDNSVKWFEWDMGFQTMRLLHAFKLIRIKNYPAVG